MDGSATGRTAMTSAIESSYRFIVGLPRPSVWERLGDVGRYQGWWPWLRRFEARALAAGDVWRCVVRPPVPYLVRFTVTFDDVEPSTSAHAWVAGDVVGEATLRATDASEGTLVSLDSTLSAGSPALRMVTRLARPVARYGHDAVMTSGIGSFLAHAAGDGTMVAPHGRSSTWATP
jgi:hypothetical protein